MRDTLELNPPPGKPGPPEKPGRRADGSGLMFDRIAHRYDLLNRLMSGGLDRFWRRSLVRTLAPPPWARVLDVATGTADVALTLTQLRPDVSVIGLDPSAEMLRLGEQKVASAGRSGRIDLQQGDAQAMPFETDAFDGACISFGIRNVPDRARALREMARVCRPGGRVVVLELGEPRSGLLGPLVRWYVHRVVPAVGALISGAPEYRYLERSIAAFPPAVEFTAMMRGCGLTEVGCRRLSFGAVHLYWGQVPSP